MKDIKLLSLLTVICLQVIGSFIHWWKMKHSGRVEGSFYDYIFADSPSHSTATIFILIGGAWFSATTGTADLVNPAEIWNSVSDGIISVKDLHIINAFIGAITTGYAVDSIVNKSAT